MGECPSADFNAAHDHDLRGLLVAIQQACPCLGPMHGPENMSIPICLLFLDSRLGLLRHVRLVHAGDTATGNCRCKSWSHCGGPSSLPGSSCSSSPQERARGCQGDFCLQSPFIDPPVDLLMMRPEFCILRHARPHSIDCHINNNPTWLTRCVCCRRSCSSFLLKPLRVHHTHRFHSCHHLQPGDLALP